MSRLEEAKQRGRRERRNGSRKKRWANERELLPSQLSGASAISKLSHKRLKFVVHRALGRGNKEAAIKAGYSPRSAYSQGSQLMRKPSIRAAMQELKESMLDDVETVFKELYGIALTDTEVKGSDKLTAIKYLLDDAYKEDAANAPQQVVVVWDEATPDALHDKLTDIEDAE